MLDKVIEWAPEYLLFVEKKSEWDAYYSTIYRSYALAWLRKGDTDKSLQIADEMDQQAKRSFSNRLNTIWTNNNPIPTSY